MPILQPVLALLGVTYLASCITLFLLQDRFLFFPSESKTHLVASHEEYELPVDTSGKISSRGYIVNGEAEGPVVVFFTGNWGEARIYVDKFAEFGVPVVITNYRGFGKSDGKPREKTMISDAKQLVGWVRSRFPDRPMVLMGNSLGTGVAILASDEHVDGLILVAPYRSLVHVGRKTPFRFFPLKILMRTKLDVRSRLKALPEKILVVYSQEDTLIPTEETINVLDQLPQAHVVTTSSAHYMLLWTVHVEQAIKYWLNTQFVEWSDLTKNASLHGN